MKNNQHKKLVFLKFGFIISKFWTIMQRINCCKKYSLFFLLVVVPLLVVRTAISGLLWLWHELPFTSSATWHGTFCTHRFLLEFRERERWWHRFSDVAAALNLFSDAVFSNASASEPRCLEKCYCGDCWLFAQLSLALSCFVMPATIHHSHVQRHLIWSFLLLFSRSVTPKVCSNFVEC